MCVTVNFLSQKMLLQITGDCGSNYGWLHIVKKEKEILMCICTVLWKKGSFCYCFHSFIMQWFSFCGKAERKGLCTLPQTETVFKGLEPAVDRWDKGREIHINDSCSVCFNNCIFYR